MPRDGQTAAEVIVSRADASKPNMGLRAGPGRCLGVEVKPTTAAGSTATSVAGAPILVDGHTWSGNGSLISKASGTKTGYGLTQDEAVLAAGTAGQVLFFQWELDNADGTKLALAAPGPTTATLTYGKWNDRSKDVTRTVTLPHTLDPAADRGSTADGEYYVIKLAFAAAPAAKTQVTATIVK